MMLDTIDFNGQTYKIIKLLGKGKGGYSYLVEDKAGTEFVIKKIHHEPCSYYSFGNKLESEINDYNKLKSVGIRMPRMLGFDEREEYILKEYIEGCTIYDLVLSNEDTSIYLKQIHKMCELLYPANLNIDYFPTNFVVRDGIIYYIDYECNEYSNKWNFENWGIKYWSNTSEFEEYVKNH